MGKKDKEFKKEKPQRKSAAASARVPILMSLAIVGVAVLAAYFFAGGGGASSALRNATAPEKPKQQPPQQQQSPKQQQQQQQQPPRREQVETAAAAADATHAAAADATPDLRDDDANCASWAANGECARNPGFMGASCARSCAGKLPAGATADEAARAAKAQARSVVSGGKKQVKSAAVDWTPPTLPADLAAAQAEHDAGREAQRARLGGRLWPQGRCEDSRADCASLARHNLSGCGEAEVLLTGCPKTCRTCSYHELIAGLSECKDTNDQCATWAKAGECENNRRFMLSGCSRACDVCGSKKVGCSRRNAVPGVREGTGLTELFERAPIDFPQYSPTVLSSPAGPVEGGPWVLQFEDLISPEEARAMIGIAGDKLERSLAGDQLSPVRTSTQYWCDDSDDCTSHPVVLAVTERIMNITRMPVNNAEYFQILRYEPGQFYKQHHDQQTAHWTPQGVRVLTFFVYLSDVEAGGGTKFNDLGITVTPKLGRAVLWPSVIAGDLLTGEKNTHHEALAVERGIKFAANLWIHLYDFKSPSRAGLCPFLGQNTHGGT